MTDHDTPEDPRAGAGPGNYEVGYGKPPKHSRFKDGERRNPKGRPPGPSKRKSLLSKLEERVKVREGNRIKTMSKVEIGLTKSVNKFVETGDLRFLKTFSELCPDLFGGAAGEVIQQLVDHKPRPNAPDVLAWYRKRIIEQHEAGAAPASGRTSDDDME